jgi:hypothetical protein
MAEWTNVEGSHNSKTVSIKKILKNVLQDEDYVLEFVDREFSFRFESEGEKAVKLLNQITKEFKTFDPKARITLNANISFFA